MPESEAGAQPKAEEQVQDLDPEVIYLRRKLAEAEVARDQSATKNTGLWQDLKEAREALGLRDRRIADLEESSEHILTSAKAQADEMLEVRLELKEAQALMDRYNETVDSLAGDLVAAHRHAHDLETALSSKERLT